MLRILILLLIFPLGGFSAAMTQADVPPGDSATPVAAVTSMEVPAQNQHDMTAASLQPEAALKTGLAVLFQHEQQNFMQLNQRLAHMANAMVLLYRRQQQIQLSIDGLVGSSQYLKTANRSRSWLTWLNYLALFCVIGLAGLLAYQQRLFRSGRN